MSFARYFSFVSLDRSLGTRGRIALALCAASLIPSAALAASVVESLVPSVTALEYVSKLAPKTNARTDADSSGRMYMPIVYLPPRHVGAVHLHGGLFAPINASGSSASLGARLGAYLGDPLLLGLSFDWVYHSENQLGAAGPALPGPGLVPQQVLASASSSLLPVMAFLQVSPWEKYALIPYVGVAGGYEWLVVRGDNYQTSDSYGQTFGNWAWQGWAGMGIRLSPGLRLDGEAFYNGGTLARDTYDPNNVRFREAVDIDGAGARFGLNIAY
jgi:hypothetical protein